MNRLLLLPAAALLLAACSDDDPTPTPMQALEIVTVLRPESPALLEMQRTDCSPKVTLEAPVSLPEGIAKDDRILIRYSAATADTAQRPVPIRLLGYSRIVGGEVRARTTYDISRLPAAQMKVVSCWRTGDYLNLQLLMRYDGTPRSFMLTADAATLEADTLRCYLYNTGQPVGENYVESRTYASFDISLVAQPGQAISVEAKQ